MNRTTLRAGGPGSQRADLCLVSPPVSQLKRKRGISPGVHWLAAALAFGLLRYYFGVLLIAALPVFALSPVKPQERTPRAQQRTGRIDKPSDMNRLMEDLSEGATFRFEIAPKLPLFTFKIIPDVRDDQNGFPQSTVQDVEVFRGNFSHPLQRLTGCDFSEMEPPQRNGDWFHTDDLNFDGYQDIYLMTNWGATGNHYGCIWLYNPETGKFDYSKEFSQLSRYLLDPATKTIRTFDRGGMAGQVYRASQYKVARNRPVLIWSERQDCDASKKQFHCVLQERRNGVMVTTRDVWGDSDEPACHLPLSWFQSAIEKKE